MACLCTRSCAFPCYRRISREELFPGREPISCTCTPLPGSNPTLMSRPPVRGALYGTICIRMRSAHCHALPTISSVSEFPSRYSLGSMGGERSKNVSYSRCFKQEFEFMSFSRSAMALMFSVLAIFDSLQPSPRCYRVYYSPRRLLLSK